MSRVPRPPARITAFMRKLPRPGACGAWPRTARCHMRCSSASRSRAKRCAVEQRAEPLLPGQVGLQRGAVRRIRRQGQHLVAIGVHVVGRPVRPAALRAAGWRPRAGRRSGRSTRDHRHADPQRLARGGVGVARPGVEEDVGAGQAARCCSSGTSGANTQPFGVDAARGGRRRAASPRTLVFHCSSHSTRVGHVVRSNAHQTSNTSGEIL